MKNFITFIIFCNLVHCTDSNIKIEKYKLKIEYKGYSYKNTEEIIIDKNKKIDIGFIKDLVKNKKLKDNKEHLDLDKNGNYEITDNKKTKIEDFVNIKVNGSTDGYLIRIKKYYILPKGSNISVTGYSADLEGQKVYLDDLNFKSKKDFINSVFKKFKSLKLENKDYNPKEILLEDKKGEDYYIQDDFYKKIKNEKYDKKKKTDELDKKKFKKLLDDNKKLNIYIWKYKRYKIKNLKLDEHLERKFKITEECKKKIIGKNLTFRDSKNTEYICNFLNINYIKELRTIDINNKYLNNDTFKPIFDNDLDIVITDFFEKNAINIVPKTAKINITSKENIFIIDKKKYKSKKLDFKKDNIDTDTVISDYIDKTYPELKGHYDLKVVNDKDGKFEDGTKITITIRDIIENVTTAKNPDKIYVKINFEVSDKTKYRLKENILELNDKELELEKGSKYENLIEIVKGKLENTAFKDGFVVLFNGSNFTTGDLTNNGIYTFKLDNLDTNFVVENIIDVKKDDSKKGDKDEIKMSKYKPSNKGKNKPDIGGDKPKGKCQCCCCN